MAGRDTVRAPQAAQSSTAGAGPGTLRLLWISARPEQWVKNGFVLAALVFARQYTDAAQVTRALACLGCFVCLSVSVYLWNDVCDRQSDRQHPQKRGRPIASGALGSRLALLAALIAAAAGLLGALALGLGVLSIGAGYLANSALYTLWLKREAILDVMSISAGFLLRAGAGAVALGVGFSPWLLLCTLLLSLFLGLCKRRGEVVALGEGATAYRRALAEYSPAFVDQAIALVTASTLLAYALYTLSPEVQAKLHSSHLPWTIPIVLYGLLRYLHLVYHQNRGDDPSRLLMHDRPLLISIAVWSLTVLLLLLSGESA